MIYLYILKNGKIDFFADKKIPLEKYGLKKPIAEITEKQLEESRGIFRLVNDKIELGPTDEELREELAQKNRCKRDALLKDTDKYLLIDFPIKPELLEKLKTYRQLLRDLPETKEWPDIKKWPKNPLL